MVSGKLWRSRSLSKPIYGSCDDKDARDVARSHGSRVTGTLGALQEAADKGLHDLRGALSKLRRTNFRISKGLIESILNERGLS